MRPLNIVLCNPPDSGEGPGEKQPGNRLHVYDPRVTPWQIADEHFPYTGNSIEQLRYLLRYAILAPSSHNSQPWKFSVGENEIEIFADMTRRLEIADADERELHISLGCALENLLIAADRFGFDHIVNYHPDAEACDPVVTVRLVRGVEPTIPERSELFDALTARHTNRGMYELRPVSKEDRCALYNCANEEGVALHLSNDPEVRRKVVELTIRADEMRFDDLAYRRELGFWLGQGVLGNSRLMSKLQGWVVAHLDVGKSTARKDAELLMSAPLWGLICSNKDDRISQIKVGRLFERICLTGMRLGLGIQPMSQILEVPDIRKEVAMLVPNRGGYPQHAFRLGYAQPLDRHTPRRRPLEVSR